MAALYFFNPIPVVRTSLVLNNWALTAPDKVMFAQEFLYQKGQGWSGGAMVLGKLPEPGCPTIWVIVRQGPIALAVGEGGVVRTFLLSSFTLSLGDGPI